MKPRKKKRKPPLSSTPPTRRTATWADVFTLTGTTEAENAKCLQLRVAFLDELLPDGRFSQCFLTWLQDTGLMHDVLEVAKAGDEVASLIGLPDRAAYMNLLNDDRLVPIDLGCGVIQQCHPLVARRIDIAQRNPAVGVQLDKAHDQFLQLADRFNTRVYEMRWTALAAVSTFVGDELGLSWAWLVIMITDHSLFMAKCLAVGNVYPLHYVVSMTCHCPPGPAVPAFVPVHGETDAAQLARFNQYYRTTRTALQASLPAKGRYPKKNNPKSQWTEWACLLYLRHIERISHGILADAFQTSRQNIAYSLKTAERLINLCPIRLVPLDS